MRRNTADVHIASKEGKIYMSKFFRALAIIIIVISIFVLFTMINFVNVEEIIALAFGAFSGVVSGLLLYTVGDLLDRVNYLEDKLNMHLPVQSDEKLPQIKCSKCGKEYDMDYPKCPYCGATTDFTK